MAEVRVPGDGRSPIADEAGRGDEESDAKFDDGNGRVAIAPTAGLNDGQRAEPAPKSASEKKKASLEEQLLDMKAQRDRLKKERAAISMALKQAQRKRRRLKRKALGLSQNDLFELCRMKDYDPDKAMGDQTLQDAESGARASTE